MKTYQKLKELAIKLASVQDVLDRIDRKISNPTRKQEMKDKVLTYHRTEDPRDDLDLFESNLLYPKDDLGDEYTVGQREVDINWTSQ